MHLDFSNGKSNKELNLHREESYSRTSRHKSNMWFDHVATHRITTRARESRLADGNSYTAENMFNLLDPTVSRLP